MDEQNQEPNVSTRRLTQERLQAYYESIEDLFAETQKSMAAQNDGLKGAAFVAFIFSLLPILPGIIFLLVRRFTTDQTVSLLIFQVRLHSFLWIWLLSILITLVLMALMLKYTGPSKGAKKRWLKPTQLRFAHCYALLRGLRNYRTNRMESSLDTTDLHFRFVAFSLFRIGPGGMAHDILTESGMSWVNVGGPSPEWVALHRIPASVRPRWYQLTPQTEKILSALGDFGSKVGDRLKDRKDLRNIESAIEDLAGYFYSEVPGIFDDGDDEALKKQGLSLLTSFASKIESLSPYQAEPVRPTTEEKLSIKVNLIWRWVSGLFSHEKLIVSFLAWYLLSLGLFLLGFRIAFHLFPSLNVDTTIVTTFVAGPIAAAVTAVTVPRLGKRAG